MPDAWPGTLKADPRPWLLEESVPAVRAATLVRLLGRSPTDPDVVAARAHAMRADPIKGILQAQDSRGWWVKPGPGYGPKYTGTVWNLMFLEQLGADPADERIQAACRYVLERCPTAVGGFGCSGSKEERNPPPSAAIHCLNGNLLRALLGFGHFDDPRVRGAVDWAARTILGEGVERWYAVTPGPGFACGVNENLPCAWGAVKELRALASIPPRRRTARVRRAIATGVEFLFSRDPADADYPMGWGNTRPSSSWFKLGFPSGYVADVLQVLEVLAELGHARDPRLERAMDWLAAQQDARGRWANRYAYQGKTSVPIEAQGAPSKWVTLRACTVLKAAD
ncbi:MAG: nitrogen fixation protein NifH [Actinomycetota bacterium]